MAMRRCPECGEMYSDTYKRCPFCEEEEALRQGGQIRRGGRGGKRVAQGGRQPNLLSPILIVVILLMACLLVYLLFGDKIAEKLGGGQEPVTPPTEDVDPVEPEPDADPAVPDGTMPGDPDGQDGSGETVPAEMTYEQAAALPAGLTLSSTDFSLFSVGESSTITVSGGTGNYQWFSEDEGVASVDASGKVTAISRGDIRIVVTDGQKQGACIVRVKVSGGAAAPAPSGGENKLNREDMTLSVGEKFQLKLTGITTALSWSSADAGVASVSGDGTVTGVAPGKTTITVSWDGASRSCVVYVKR